MTEHVEIDRKSLKKPDLFLKYLNQAFKWLQARTLYIYVLAGLITAGFASYFAYDQYRQSQEEKATQAYYTLYREYDNLLKDYKQKDSTFKVKQTKSSDSAASDTAKENVGQALETHIVKIRDFIGKFPATFAAFEARMLVGKHYYELSQLGLKKPGDNSSDAVLIDSVDAYDAAYKNAKSPEQKAFALLGRAYSQEKLNRLDDSVKTFSEIERLNKKIFKPEAMFGIARILASKNDIEQAVAKYQQIAIEFANGPIAKAAEAQKQILENSVRNKTANSKNNIEQKK